MNILHIINAIRILGLLLMPFSLSMIPPIFVALWYHENTISVFLSSTLITLLFGFILWAPFRKDVRDIQARDGFLIVTLLWIVLSLTGTLPFTLSINPHINYIDAFFETISGLTTTGATVLVNLDSMPRSILYYRQQLQFIGGGGIILLGIAILPMLGVGGMQLFRAEITGPFKEEKLTPRVAQTSKTLWMIYVGLVLFCAMSFWAGGMSLFDAIAHSFSAISTGGFSTHDSNFEFFNSILLKYLAIFFMMLGAINFSLHFVAARNGTLKQYWQDLEFRSYIFSWLALSLLVIATFLYYHEFSSVTHNVLEGLFHVTSCLTTTGFFSTNINEFPTFVPVLLMFLSILGGCAGSTAGGIKMIRLLILRKQGIREIQRLIHPNGHYVIKLGYSLLHHRTLDAIWGFFYIFVAFFVVLLLLFLATGLDLLTAFSTLAACISNGGLGLGSVSEHFRSLNDSAKVIASFAMLAGRLELFSLLVLFAPSYWKN